jgi:hypothetical protein
MIVHSLVAEKRLPETIPNFKCYNHFLRNFLLGRGLSLRTARAARPPEINDEECSAFLCALNKIQQELRLNRVINFDENNRHLVMSEDEAVEEIGSEVVLIMWTLILKQIGSFCFGLRRRISSPFDPNGPRNNGKVS